MKTAAASRSPGIIVECPGLKLLDPDPDQVARDVVASGERVKGFARNEFLGDLSFEFDLWERCLAMAFIL